MLRSASRDGRRIAHLLAFALAAGAAILLFARFRDAGLPGWDTYPLIETSRVGSASDLADLFRSSLMGKREGGTYYRPLTKLSFALDHALWGLWGPGYQLGNALLFGATTLAVYGLAACLLPGPGRVAALAALLFFALHPVHATVVPVPSRRADVLCVLFTCLTLAAQARSLRGGHTRATLPAALASLALLSKETAFLLVALVPWVGLVVSRQATLGARLREAAAASVPVWLVAGGVLVARAAVLGSLSGERPFREEAFVPAALAMAGRVASWSLSPGIWVGDRDLPAVPLALLATLTLVSGGLATRQGRAAAALASLPPFAVALAWFLLATLVYSVGVILQPWYVVNPIAALAVLCSGVVAGLLRLAGSGRRAMGPAAAGLACVALLLVQLAAYSPLVRSYADWRAGRDVADRYLDALERDIAGAADGSLVRAGRPPPRLPAKPDAPRLAGVTLLAPYSVESWIRLTFPERRIRIAVAGRGETRPRADEVLVVLGGRAGSRPAQGR